MMMWSFVTVVVSKKDAGEISSFGRSRSPLQGVVLSLYCMCVHVLCMYMCVHAQAHGWACACTCVCMCVCMCICVCVCMCVCKCVCMACVHIMYTYVTMYTYMWSTHHKIHVYVVYVCIYVSICYQYTVAVHKHTIAVHCHHHHTDHNQDGGRLRNIRAGGYSYSEAKKSHDLPPNMDMSSPASKHKSIGIASMIRPSDNGLLPPVNHKSEWVVVISVDDCTIHHNYCTQ